MNEQLKILRQTLKLSQIKMAEALDIAPKSWQQYENGAITPGGNVFEALHKKLGVNLNWLISGQGEMFQREGGIPFDRELLIQAMITLEKCLSERGMAFEPLKKSKVAAKLYENLKKSGVVAGKLEVIEKEVNDLIDLL